MRFGSGAPFSSAHWRELTVRGLGRNRGGSASLVRASKEALMVRSARIFIAAMIIAGLPIAALAQGGGGGGGGGGAGAGGAGGASGSGTGSASSGTGGTGATGGTSTAVPTQPGTTSMSNSNGTGTTTGQAQTQAPSNQVSPALPRGRVGTAPNGRPIGSPGSGPGSPEQPY